ncbi:MAG: hypothetical protein BWY27_01305 [Bacteroidetes bacterium ADurb.Bin234]|nr:MAG: hypothetical protein BWY27_01305 [Bacteroidetes bacterium ADurb.Bin234]
MVVMVLSQFSTLTVFRLMAVTSPSALNLGISIQSPIRTISLEDICTLATNPSIVSLKTNNKIAESAPKALSKYKGDLLMMMDIISMATIM